MIALRHARQALGFLSFHLSHRLVSEDTTPYEGGPGCRVWRLELSTAADDELPMRFSDLELAMRHRIMIPVVPNNAAIVFDLQTRAGAYDV